MMKFGCDDSSGACANYRWKRLLSLVVKFGSLLDLFRLPTVSWRCPQLCPGSGRVENVRYRLPGLALTTTTTKTVGNIKCDVTHFYHATLCYSAL